MRYSHILATVLAFFTLSFAWPWPPTLPDIQALKRVEEYLGKRQDSGNNNGGGGNGNGGGSSVTGTSGGSSPSTVVQTSQTGDQTSLTAPPKSDSQPTNTSGGDSKTDSQTDSKTDGGDNKTSDTATSSTSVPPGVNGGINMITPAATAVATQYYSVGSTITWVWNYTSLATPPKRVDIVASMSGSGNQAKQTPFTLASNETWAVTQNFTWDTNAFHSQTPLGVGMYALQVFDADAPGGVSATPSPGHLGVVNSFQFGVYTGQVYTALSNPYICSTCNAASSLLQPSVLKMAVGMSALAVGSFMYFGAEFGAI